MEHFNELNMHGKIYRYPVVNWGRERLLPYESLISFSFKFCKLNGISLSQLNKLIYSITKDNNWWQFNFNALQCKKFARLLDEKTSSIRTLKSSTFELPIIYGDFQNLSLTRTKNVLRYCPVCIKAGYVAIFHECDWLEKCPLHLVNIIEKNINFSPRETELCRKIKTMDGLLEKISPNWHQLNHGESILADFSSPFFRQFIAWLNKVHSHKKLMLKQNILSLPQNDMSIEDIDVVLDRLNWLVPIPKKIRVLFGPPMHGAKPKIIDLPFDLVKNIAYILERDKEGEFIEFYKISLTLLEANTHYKELINDELKKLNAMSIASRGGWRYSKLRGWWYADDDDPLYAGTQSIYDFCSDFIINKWVSPWHAEENRSHIKLAWSIYCNNAEFFVKAGVAEMLPDCQAPMGGLRFKYSSPRPVVKISIPLEVENVINEILCEDAKNCIEEVERWLSTIDKGASPSKGPIIGSSIINVFISSRRAYLSMWENKKIEGSKLAELHIVTGQS